MTTDEQLWRDKAFEPVEEPDVLRPMTEDHVEEPARPSDVEVDSVHRYFHQISRVPLLKPKEERALCEKIEEAQRALAATILMVPTAARELANRADAVRQGKLPVEELFESPEGSILGATEVKTDRKSVV